MVAQLLELLTLGRPVWWQETLAHPYRAELPRARLAGQPVDNPDKLQRPAAEIEHTAVAQRRRVDGGQVAVAGLCLAAEHADRQSEALASPPQEAVGVLGIADRARRDGVHRILT